MGHVEDGSGGSTPSPDPRADPYDGLAWWAHWEDEHWYGTVVPLHSSTTPLASLRADGDWLVWEEGFDIAALHTPTGSLVNVTADLAKQARPAIDGSRVVYEQWTGTKADLWLFDLDTGTRRQLTTSADTERSPEIVGPWVVWLDNRLGEWNVWSINLDNGTEVPVSVSNTKKQDLVVLGDGIVAWREIEYNQWDIYVRKLPDGKVKALTRDRTLEHPPQTDGRYLYWVKAPAGSAENAMHRWDPETGEIRILGRKGVSTNPVAFLDGGVEILYTPSGPGLNTFIAMNRTNDRLTIIAPHFPATRPVWSGKSLFLIGSNETHSVILLATVSPYAVATPPELKILRPLDGGVVAITEFAANGQYLASGAWPAPTRLEWRVGGRSQDGRDLATEWKAFPAEANWTAPIELPTLADRDAFRLHFRAVYDDAPPIAENVGASFRIFRANSLDLDGEVDLSLANFVAKNPGVLLLVFLAVAALFLLVARWRLRRVPRGAVRVEYLRPPE